MCFFPSLKHNCFWFFSEKQQFPFTNLHSYLSSFLKVAQTKHEIYQHTRWVRALLIRRHSPSFHRFRWRPLLSRIHPQGGREDVRRVECMGLLVAFKFIHVRALTTKISAQKSSIYSLAANVSVRAIWTKSFAEVWRTLTSRNAFPYGFLSVSSSIPFKTTDQQIPWWLHSRALSRSLFEWERLCHAVPWKLFGILREQALEAEERPSTSFP